MTSYFWSLGWARWIAFLSIWAIGLGGLVLPLLRYLKTGWKAKRKDILDGLGADARVAYFNMFCRAEETPTPGQALTSFDAFYIEWYGRKYFATPSVFYLAACLAITMILAMSGLHFLGVLPAPPEVRVPSTALAALAGAYLWVANDLTSRARRLDFSPADVAWASLRLIIAIPMGYAFSRVGAPDLAPLIAFGLGTFPLATITATLSRITNKALNQDATSVAARSDLTKLQGVNQTIIDRLADEDITTVTQIAYCDPVRLTMRSNLSFNFITDCMNQALAWLYFEDQLSILRSFGLRGACEIRSLIDDYDATDLDQINVAHASALAQIAVPLIAAKLGQDQATLQNCFRQIGDDPFTIFLTEVWS